MYLTVITGLPCSSDIPLTVTHFFRPNTVTLSGEAWINKKPSGEDVYVIHLPVWLFCRLVVKQNRFLAETPKPKQGPWEKTKFWQKPKFRPKHFFRPKQPLSAKMFCFGQNNIWFYTRFLAKIGAKRDYTLFRP